MEITINNNGDLVNTTTQEKPVIQDTYTVLKHNIDEPYKEVEKIVDTFTIINKLDSLTTNHNSLLELLNDNSDILVENDLENNIDSTRNFCDSIHTDIEELKQYRDKFFVSDDNKKEKLTVKQLKYILSNKKAENVLKMNILTQLHHGSTVNTDLDISDKIDTVFNQLDTVYSELSDIIYGINHQDADYEDDYYDDWEDDYDDYEDDYQEDDLNDSTKDYDDMTHNELIDYIEKIRSQYSELKKEYDNLV